MGFLQDPGPSQKLAQQYGIRGLFSPDIVPSLQPVVLIDDLTGGLAQIPQKICVASFGEAAVVGEVAVWRIETPPRVIARIDLIMASGSSNNIAAFFGSSFAVTPANAATETYTDGRLRSQGRTPQCQIVSDTQVATLAANDFIFTSSAGATTPVPFRPGWIFGRTDGENFDFIEFQVQAANAAIDVSMQWTEFDAQVVR